VRCVESGLTSDASRLQVNLEIALSGVSAKVKPFNHPFTGRKCVEASDDVIKTLLRTFADFVKALFQENHRAPTE
jgi:hypothetical protein